MPIRAMSLSDLQMWMGTSKASSSESITMAMAM